MAKGHSLSTWALMALLSVRLLGQLSLLNYEFSFWGLLVVAAYAAALYGIANREAYGRPIVYIIVLFDLIFTSSLSRSAAMGAKAMDFLLILLASSQDSPGSTAHAAPAVAPKQAKHSAKAKK